MIRIHHPTSQNTGDETPIELPPFGRRVHVSNSASTNDLLQALPAAEFEALPPYLRSIVAHALQQVGMIRYSQRHIETKDVDALRQTSCECFMPSKHSETACLKAAE